MNNERTPLVQKLILGVLTLILISLVVLIAQNRRKPAAPVSNVDPPSPEPALVAETPAPRSTDVVVTGIVPRQSRQPGAILPLSTPDAVPAASQPAPIGPAPGPTAPNSHVTLVNPVRPQPIDFALRPPSQGATKEICGRVRLEGTPPPEVPIRLDETCRRLNEGPLMTRHYVVGPERGLANVLVYIKEGLRGYHSPPQQSASVLSASGCFFEPYVLGVQTGKPLVLVNADNVLHNFNAKAGLNRGFNLSMPLRGAKEKTFENPEVFVRLKCDVHPWEFAYVGVVEHAFFSVTDTNGVFCLPAGLPRGRCVVAAVHVKAGETTREVIVDDDSIPTLELALNVPSRH